MKKRAEQLVARAGELARAGDREKALLALQRAAELDPENIEIQRRITELEREQTAMRNFSKSRSARVHADIGRAAAQEDFVSECMKRSDAALAEGDEVRALQELERAHRHDPENSDVKRKVNVLRRRIKVNGLADKAMARLEAGRPAEAVAAIRQIFEVWSMAPVLPSLIARMESWTPETGKPAPPAVPRRAKPEVEARVVPAAPPEPEEEAEAAPSVPAAPPEPEEEAEAAPSVPAVPPESVIVASIRGRIARSAYREAYQEALEAREKYPENETVKEFIAGLEKILGKEPEEPGAREPVTAALPPVSEKPSGEVKKTRKKGFPPGIAAIAAVLLVAVVILIFKPFSGPREEVPEGPAPYSISFDVTGAENPTVSLGGRSLSPDPATGLYTFSDTVPGPLTLEIRAAGYETLSRIIEPSFGDSSAFAFTLDTLGTHRVTVEFTPVMPEGRPEPEPGQVTYMLDGVPVQPPLEVPTGLHVFQPVMEGYNSLAESILVDYSTTPQNLTLALLSRQESQVALSLAADVPGTANFDIDGERVGTGVRRVTSVLPLGTHTLRVTMENREPWVETITLTENGYTRTVSPVETVRTGRLLIGPEPWADVYVNGEAVGQTPMPPLELEEGAYTVRLSNPDYEDQVSTVTITAGEDTSIRYTASPVEPEVIESPSASPVIPPFPISQTAPVTPDLAQRRGDVHGFVTLEARVGTDGRVRDVSVISDQVGLGCGQAAMDAVRQWVFSPATQDGVPVEVTTTVQIRFDVE